MKLPLPVVFDLMEPICAALQYAHAAKDSSGRALEVVHRDLKPGNVIIARNGVFKVMDFGIAKTTSNLFVTMTTGVAKGTPLYMSPEQIEGRKDLDCRSDIFALGALIYELATGDRLFESEGVANMFWKVLKCEVDEQMAVLDELMPGLGRAAHGCLKADKTERYNHAGELAAVLRSLRPPEWADQPGLPELVLAMIGVSSDHDPTLGDGSTTEGLLTRFENLADSSLWPSFAAGLRKALPSKDDPLVDGLQPIYNDSDLDTLVNRAMTAPRLSDAPPIVVPPPPAPKRGVPASTGLALFALLLIGILVVLLLPASDEAPPTPGIEAQPLPTASSEPVPELVVAPAPVVETTPEPEPEPVSVSESEVTARAAPEFTPRARVEASTPPPRPTPDPDEEPTPEEEPATPGVLVNVRLNTIPWSNLSTGQATPVLGVDMEAGTVIVATEPQTGQTHTFVVQESWAGQTMCWNFRTDDVCAR
jgi:serine/threonine protein kinase